MIFDDLTIDDLNKIIIILFILMVVANLLAFAIRDLADEIYKFLANKFKKIIKRKEIQQ